MKRSEYFNYIEEKLNFLSYRIKSRGKINLLDLNRNFLCRTYELFVRV